METSIPSLGAFGFGVIIGWFVYLTNRYRKGEVQFSDLTTLLGVIGGGAVTALFGPASATLFGAYGLGLFVGFFAYFATLILLVRASNGVFGWTWFLDGRRKDPDPEQRESIPSDVRPTVAPMAMQPTLAERVAVLENRQNQMMATPLPQAPAMALGLGQAGRSPLAEAVEQRDRAIAAVADALRDLVRRMGEAASDADRAKLQQAFEQLTLRHDELIALRLKDILDSDQVRSALVRLNRITSDLVEEAKVMKTASDTIAATAKIVDRLTKVIGFLAALSA